MKNNTGQIALVILAAGASRRLGSCKALVELGGGAESTPLARLLHAGEALQPAASMVISGKHQRPIAEHLGRWAPTARLVHNENWEQGRSTGVRLAHLQMPAHDLCLAPVDVPLVPSAVFQQLAQAWQQAGCPQHGWLAPHLKLDGSKQHGHPVIVGRALLDQIGEDWGQRSLRDLRALAQPLLSLEVHDASILDDLDEPGDLERLRERLSS